MEWLQTIVTGIGLLIIWYFQRKKIDALEKTVKTQNQSIETQSQVIKDIKAYSDLYNPEKLAKSVEIHRDAIDAMKKVEIERIQKEYDGLLKEREETTQERIENIMKTMTGIIEGSVNIAVDSYVILSPPQRKIVLSRIYDPGFLRRFTQLDENMTKRETNALLDLITKTKSPVQED